MTAHPRHTISFPAVTAKFFRVVFKRTGASTRADWSNSVDPTALGISAASPPADYEIAELVLHPGRACEPV